MYLGGITQVGYITCVWTGTEGTLYSVMYLGGITQVPRLLGYVCVDWGKRLQKVLVGIPRYATWLRVDWGKYLQKVLQPICRLRVDRGKYLQ